MLHQVSGLIAVLQDPVVDVLLLDLRDEDAFAQYHVTGGMWLQQDSSVERPVTLQCIVYTAL